MVLLGWGLLRMPSFLLLALIVLGFSMLVYDITSFEHSAVSLHTNTDVYAKWRVPSRYVWKVLPEYGIRITSTNPQEYDVKSFMPSQYLARPHLLIPTDSGNSHQGFMLGSIVFGFLVVLRLWRKLLRFTSPPWTIAATGDATQSPDPKPPQPPAEPSLFGIPLQGVVKPLAVFLVSQTMLYTAAGTVAPGMPKFAQTLGIGPTTLGILLTSCSISGIPFNPLSGQFADTIGRRPLLILGLFLFATGDFLTGAFCGFGPTMAHRIAPGPAVAVAVMLVARLVMGVGKSMAETSERALLADLCDRAPAARGRLVALPRVVTGLGLVAGPLLGALAAERWGPGAPFYCVALAAMLSVVMYAALLPETLDRSAAKRTTSPRLKDVAEEAAMLPAFEVPVLSEPGEPEVGARVVWGRLLLDPAQRALLAAVVAQSLGAVAQGLLMPLFLAGPRFLASGREMGLVFSAAELLALCSALVSGTLLDAGLSFRVLVPASCLTCSAGLLLAASAPRLATMVGAFALWGLGAGMLAPALHSYAQCLAPKGREGVSLALPKTVMDFSLLFGAFALGRTAELVGMGAALATCGWVSLGAAALFVLWGRDVSPAAPTPTPPPATPAAAPPSAPVLSPA